MSRFSNFIKKPVSCDKISFALKQVLLLISKRKERLLNIINGNEVLSLETDKIRLIESDRRKVTFHLNDMNEEIYNKISI